MKLILPLALLLLLSGCTKGLEAFSMHIPAHREHLFWFNVNTHSGRT